MNKEYCINDCTKGKLKNLKKVYKRIKFRKSPFTIEYF